MAEGGGGKVGDAFVAIGGDLKGLKQALKEGQRETEQSASKMEKSFDRMKGGKGARKGAAIDGAGGAGGGIAGKLGPLTKGIADLTTKMLGVAAAIGAMGFATKKAAAAFDESSSIQTRWAKAIGNLGGDPAAKMARVREIEKDLGIRFFSLSSREIKRVTTRAMERGIDVDELRQTSAKAIGAANRAGITPEAMIDVFDRARRGGLSVEAARDLRFTGIGPGDVGRESMLRKMLQQGADQATLFEKEKQGGIPRVSGLVFAAFANVWFKLIDDISAVFRSKDYLLDTAREQQESTRRSLGMTPEELDVAGGSGLIIPGKTDIQRGLADPEAIVDPAGAGANARHQEMMGTLSQIANNTGGGAGGGGEPIREAAPDDAPIPQAM